MAISASGLAGRAYGQTGTSGHGAGIADTHCVMSDSAA